ncbi:heavy metal translocating P-type ATPase [Halovenus marina]|uniref:heavy metal translocating P-type ATPase n=1 Tax=Halovenus marina TaxID=3396621 RepID=UPI003F557B78
MADTEQSCTLCDLPVSEPAVENETGDPFCCRGCRDVHGTLSEREDLSPDDNLEHIQETLTEETETPEGYERTFLRVDGMHCATCETFIEARASDHEDVAGVAASYITDTVRIDHDPAVEESELTEAVTGLGYRAYARDDPLGKRRAEDNILTRLIVGAVFGMMVMLNYVAIIYPTYFDGLYYPAETAAFLAEMLASASAAYFYLVVGLLSSIVLFYTGGPILKGAWVSLRTREPNMDLLVALAATAAWAYSTLAIFLGAEHIYYDVSVGIVLVVTAGSYYESQIKRKATEQLANLTESQVSETRRYHSDGSTTTVPVADLSGGERVLVRDGERIPVDGVVHEGEGTVDEAVVTGESLPVAKTAGDEVVGGSLLQDGSLVIEVNEGATSSVDRITDMVWDLQSADHGIQQLADRLATVFVPVVLVLAMVVGVAHFALGASASETLLVALTVLIVSCPCALGLATPLAIATSIHAALERGIVVFDETIFERLRDVEVVIFDKTGTLTTGEMRVRDADGPEDLFEQAALLETRSSHPIAEAIATAYGNADRNTDSDEYDSPGRVDPESLIVDRSDQQTTDGGVVVDEDDEHDEAGEHDETAELDDQDECEARVSGFQSYATGVGGTVDGADLLVGHPDLFAEQGWSVPDAFGSQIDDARDGGNVPVLVGRDGTAEGLLVVGDEPREGWESVLADLAAQDIEVAILTGDERDAATAFEDHPAVDHVFAGVPPEAKAETVQQFGAGRQTVMVGDGTNDAPALASANLGIALGSGTALAADAADVAIVTDDLRSLETVFDLAAAANSRVKQNIGWAFLYNSIAIPLAITGLINPLFAAVAMGLSSTLVVTNSSRKLLE